MTKILFIEGVSGVGKSTMVQALSEELSELGFRVKSYLEGDFTNPIDFYNTAFYTIDEYEKLCVKYNSFRDVIQENTISVEDIRLVRYSNGKTPLFKEPLFSELSENEFCYHPKKIILVRKYINVYTQIWRNFEKSLDIRYDFIIFDGSLLHHPVNDMINNYNITGEQIIPHINMLLNALALRKRYIFYLKTNDIANQLKIARESRRQDAPTKKQISFWEERYKNEMVILNGINDKAEIFDVSNNGWNVAKEKILFMVNSDL